MTTRTIIPVRTTGIAVPFSISDLAIVDFKRGNSPRKVAIKTALRVIDAEEIQRPDLDSACLNPTNHTVNLIDSDLKILDQKRGTVSRARALRLAILRTTMPVGYVMPFVPRPLDYVDLEAVVKVREMGRTKRFADQLVASTACLVLASSVVVVELVNRV
jgi:hypothetical protein